MDKKNQSKIFWVSFLIFMFSLSYSLPKFSNIRKIQEEKNIIDALQGSDPYHIRWHENQLKADESEIIGARVIFLVGLGFLCFGLYYAKNEEYRRK